MEYVKSAYIILPKQLFLSLGFSFFILISSSQGIYPSVTSSSGAKFSQSIGSVTFTLGELVVFTNSGNILGNGFIPCLQSSTQFVSIKEPISPALNLNIYPNPTLSLLFVDIFSSNINFFMLDVVNIHGKLVFSEKFPGIPNHIFINAENWQNGIYFLLLKDINSNSIGKYQFIKTNN